jgi:hypothetical protein
MWIDLNRVSILMPYNLLPRLTMEILNVITGGYTLLLMYHHHHHHHHHHHSLRVRRNSYY